MIIFVLSGPSAGGKTTILEELTRGGHLPIHTRMNLERLVTTTTRLPRQGEIEGVDYYFVTEDEFEQRSDIVEKTVYAGVKYGIFDSEIQRIRISGKDAIVVLDQHGISEMKRFYGEENVVSIFVYRDLGAIKEELRRRDVSQSEKDRRFEQAKDEMKGIAFTDHVVYNIGMLSEAVEQVQSIIRSERQKRLVAATK